MGKKKHEAPEGAGEGWLVSYCDMISLLVTFFLMMMTFSTSDKGDVKAIGVGLLKGRGGVFPNLTGFGPPIEIDRSMLTNLARDLDVHRAADTERRVVLDAAVDGLAIEFGSECSFAVGSFEASEALASELAKLGPLLAKHDQLVLVEGHTDSKESETHDVERLGLERASEAARVLLASSKLRPEQLQVSSLGSTKLRAVESTALGRKLNRRVTLRVLAVTSDHALGWAGAKERDR